MALWSNTDANTSAPKNAVASGLGVSANGLTLFGNTTTSAYVTGAKIGVFGVDATEQQAPGNTKGGHAGWVLRKEGTGGRSGRVHVETLVAMGSIGTDAEDTVFADTTIFIQTQPSNASNTAGGNATFSVVATSTPSVSLSYQWYANAATISGATSNTYTATNVATQNNYYVIVSATGATSVQSANAVLTITA